MSFVVFQSPVKVKQFVWDVGDARNVERGIGGYTNTDTTAVSTTSTTRVNLKTYTFTSSANTNKIRVRVYAYVSGAVSGSSIYLNINGTDVVGPVTVTATSATLYIDYIGDIPSSTSMTIKVDGVAESGYTLYVSKVVIIAGFGLTSTTSVNILTISTISQDGFSLKVNGNFTYNVLFKWVVFGNKKTTSNVVLTSNLANKVDKDWSVSGDDGDSVVQIRMGFGNYASSFTISGYVGASGDVLIITSIYAQVDITFNYTNGLTIKENGIAYILIRDVVFQSPKARLIVNVLDLLDGSVLRYYQYDVSTELVTLQTITCDNGHRIVIGDSEDFYSEANLGFGLIKFLNIIVVSM
jgi:hypothetical protein